MGRRKPRHKGRQKGRQVQKGKATQAKGKAKAKRKAAAKAAGRMPPMPPRAPRPPLHVGECTIYSDKKQQTWRVHHSSAPRKEKVFKWSLGKESWARIAEFAEEHNSC